MIIRALIDGRLYPFDTEDESQAIGEGGEAIVLRWTPPREFTARYGDGKYAVKLFFEDTLVQRAAANMRQDKLRAIPNGLPRNAITPTTLVTNQSGRIIGYVMPLVEDVVPLSKFMDGAFRRSSGISQKHAALVLRNLHALVTAVHKADVVIGDFNDKNVLVNNKCEVFLIDVDSAQWGSWPCAAVTPFFTDPTLLDQDQNLRRGARYSQVNDWYSFAVMAYQLLTLSHPYHDGVHKPVQTPGKPRVKRLRFAERLIHRLSTFDPSVRLDRSVHHPSSLPDGLGRFLRDVFVKDRRETFPVQYLNTFNWMTCPRCGREHGRTKCPARNCGAPGVAPTAPYVPSSGAQPAATTAPTHSIASNFLVSASPRGVLQYVHHNNGAYRREDDSVVVLAPSATPGLSALVAGKRTVLVMDTNFAIVNGNPAAAARYSTQKVFGRTTVAANSHHVYWVNNSSLVMDGGRQGATTIGSVIPNMTSVWTGESFGIVLVQAGSLNRVMTFTDTPGFRGSAFLPPEMGSVVDAQCVLSDTHAWLMVAYRDRSGTVTKKCYVFNAAARLLATATSQSGARAWLDSFTSSAFAVGDKLLVPLVRTGIARIGLLGDDLRQEGVYRGAAGMISNDRATVGIALTTRGLLHISPTRISTVNTSS